MARSLFIFAKYSHGRRKLINFAQLTNYRGMLKCVQLVTDDYEYLTKDYHL